MAQVVSVTVTGSNGAAYSATKVKGFPTQGILVEAVTFPATLPDGSSNPLSSSVTQITLLATSTKYYTATATATVITACNA
jgi:hypothetical protein